MAGRLRPLAGQPPGKQHPLDGVQPAVLPRVDEPRHVAAQQPVIEERLVLLVRQIRLHDRREELRVLLRQEEVQFVAGVLRVQLAFLRVLELRPVQHERELGEPRVLGERRVQGVDLGERVV